MSERIIKECICGADIYQEKGFKDWFNVHDAQGTALYCYPDTEGPDGMALHEPHAEPYVIEEKTVRLRNLGHGLYAIGDSGWTVQRETLNSTNIWTVFDADSKEVIWRSTRKEAVATAITLLN